MPMRALPMLALLVVTSHAGWAARTDLCGQTARAGRHACANEARDDFWTAIGICTNTTDPAARASCRRAAKQESRDAAAECDDQFDARESLCEALGRGAYAPAIDPGR